MPERGLVPAYRFEMRVDGERVGAIDLRAGTTDDIERYGGHVGYSVAVANAVDEVRDFCDYTTRSRGGFGAVREFCDLVLSARGGS